MSSFYERLSPTALAVLDTTNYYGQGAIITRINVPAAFRGRGIGSALLRRAIAHADEHQTTLFLEISPSDGLGFDELEAWYRRYGFCGHSISVLRRKPNGGAR